MKNYTCCFFSLFTAIFLNLSLSAQGLLRVEIEAKKNSDNYHIVPVGKNGILLFYESNERAGNGGKNWVFSLYDTAFKEVWSKEQPVKWGLYFINSVSKNSRDIYILLGHEAQAGVLAKGNYEIVSVNTESGQIKTVNGKIPLSSLLNHFDVAGDYAYISGISVPSNTATFFSSCLYVVPVPCVSYIIFAPMIFVAHPQVYQVDLRTGGANILSKKMKGMGFIVGTGSSDKDNTESIIIRNEKSKTECKVFCKTYSGSDEIASVEIKGSKEKIINRASLLKLGSKEQVLIGTYSNAGTIKGFFRNLGPARIEAGYNAVSNGLFFTKLENDQTIFTKYYDFSKFQNFFSYYKNRYGVQQKNRQLNYLLLVHDIIVKNDQYIVVAEAYYPEYQRVAEQVYVPASGTMPGHYETRYRDIFVGYRYTHAIVAAFSPEGEKLWDNTFEIENVLTFELKEKVKVLPYDETLLLAYSYGGNIETKVIQGNQVVQGKFSTAIETSYKGDKVQDDYNNDMAYWYDNFFVTCGYARIKNTDIKNSTGKSRRTVFYFNKIAFQ